MSRVRLCDEIDLLYASFEAFTGVMFHVEVFWIVTPCSVVVGYQGFRGPCCVRLHLDSLTHYSQGLLGCEAIYCCVGYQRFRYSCCVRLHLDNSTHCSPGLLSCDAVYCDRISTFQRPMLRPSSPWQFNPLKSRSSGLWRRVVLW
jgi:hypothetical protein